MKNGFKFHVKLFIILFIPGLVNAQHYSLTLPVTPLPTPKSIDQIVEKYNGFDSNFNKLNSNEQSLFYWINYSRKNPKRFWDSAIIPVLQILPQLKSSSTETLRRDLYKIDSLPLLKLNDALLFMSREHATDIAGKQLPISHNSSNGQTFDERFKKYSNKDCGSENIAVGNENMLFNLILLYIDYGLSVPAHRNNLLSDQYRLLGISVQPYGNTQQFIVQDFSCP